MSRLLEEQQPDVIGPDQTTSPMDQLVDILDHPEQRILPLLLKSTHNSHDDESTRAQLMSVAQSLFRDIEVLGATYQQLGAKKKSKKNKKNGNNDPVQPGSLSGLAEMFIPPPNDEGDEEQDDDDAHGDLAETLFGQAELQHDALKRLLKKSTKHLAKATDKICVLNLDLMDGSGEGDVDEDGNEMDMDEVGMLEDDDEDPGHDEEEDDGEEEQDEDEETRRIRERMERAMAEDSDEDLEEKDEKEKAVDAFSSAKSKTSDEDLYDPVAEDLKDGFFDLNEMEAFADEEEEYLPDEAFGQPEDENDEKQSKASARNKKSFHQRQRDGDMLDGSDDDDDENDAMDDLYEEVRQVRRQKYRDDEEIDALYNLYQETPIDEDDGDDNIAEATATDFFGGPKKEYMERYRKNHPDAAAINDGDKKPKSKQPDGDDDDSWGDYDFENEDKFGWQGENDENQEEEEEGDIDDEEEDEKDGEEEEPMNDTEEKSASKPKTSNGADDSKLSKKEAKLRRQTAEMESELLSEKPWQMRGESKSSSRPVNSLLDATPQFEMASKQAPTITVQHTVNIEDVIKKRILAEDWDDVVPRELPDVGWHKKRGEVPEVSQEKSKLGLGELYEREYLKKAVGYDVEAAEKQTEEEKAKDEMKQLFANLCSKLDALSNYHFAPRPISDEAEVRTVTQPAIAMEEVLPLHVSDARGVAPEEVYATKRGREGILRSETEMDQTDRKRQRQSKKAARRKARREKQADEKLISRLQPGLGLNNPYEKRKAREELALARSRGKVTAGEQEMDAKFGSSGTFFKKLQAEAQETIHTKMDAATDHGSKKSSKPKSSAFKL